MESCIFSLSCEYVGNYLSLSKHTYIRHINSDNDTAQVHKQMRHKEVTAIQITNRLSFTTGRINMHELLLQL